MERLAFSCGLPAEDRERPGDASGSSSPPISDADEAAERRDQPAYRGLLAFTFVLFFRPQDTFPVLQPLHLADITGAFALIALIAGRMGRGAGATYVTRELVLVVALAGVMVATAPFSVWPGGAIAVVTDLYVKVILVFGLMINTLTTRARLERFVGVVVLGTSYIAVRAVVDYFRGTNLVEGGRVAGAVGGLFGNPNDMALNMVSFLPLAIVVLALRRTSPALRALAAVGVPAIPAAVVFSQSRGGLVALVAMLLVLLYHMRRLRPRLAGLVLAASIAALPFLPSSFVSRMSSIVNAEEDATGSREARKRLLTESYQTFLDNPLFGVGAGQFQNYKPDERIEAWRESHNAVLQVAADLGIVGVLIFLAVIVSGFSAVIRARAVLRQPKRTNTGIRAGPAGRARQVDPRHDVLNLYAAGMTASLTGWFVAAMFASVAYYWTFYIVLGLAVAVREIASSHANLSDPVGRKDCRAEAA